MMSKPPRLQSFWKFQRNFVPFDMQQISKQFEENFNFLLHQRSSGFTRTKIACIVEYGLEEITLRLLDDFG